jgi:hypothetical protein
MTYAEAEHEVLFRQPKPGIIEIWRPATKTWDAYHDYKDFAETAKSVSAARAREIQRQSAG